MKIDLTEKEIEDIKRGLVVAMQVLDKYNAGSADKKLSDRLELIFNKIGEQTH